MANKNESSPVFALIFFTYLLWKQNLEKNSIYPNNFFHNFHLSESSFTCPEKKIGWIGINLG